MTEDPVCPIEGCGATGRGEANGSPPMICMGYGTLDPRCMANWMSTDPEDREPYREYLLKNTVTNETTGELARRVLDCPMQANDAKAKTIRGYLVALAREVWREGEGFSGKRPFGNSSWEYEIYVALVHGGFVTGVLDEDCDDALSEFSRDERDRADKLIDAALRELGQGEMDA